MIHLVRLVRDAVLDKKGCRKYFYAAFTIRKAREEAVGDRLIALVLRMVTRNISVHF